MNFTDYNTACDLVRGMILDGIRRNFAEDGEVIPVSFVLATRDPDTGAQLPRPTVIVVPLAFIAQDKELLRVTQQQICDRFAALCHIFVIEGWSVQLDGPQMLEDPYAYGSLEHNPARIEIVMISMEHKEGDAFWVIPIVREGDQATLGEIRETLTGHTDGRMTGYVRPRPKVVEA